jgi:hypothetical protein
MPTRSRDKISEIQLQTMVDPASCYGLQDVNIIEWQSNLHLPIATTIDVTMHFEDNALDAIASGEVVASGMLDDYQQYYYHVEEAEEIRPAVPV